MNTKFTLLLALLCSFSVSAEIIGGIDYSFDDNALTAIVKRSDYSGNIIIPAYVEHEDATYTVTEIEFEALSRTDISSITIEAAITTLPSFEGCAQLESITLPNSITSFGNGYNFQNCDQLKKVNGFEMLAVKELSDGIFSNCSNLANISLPTNLETINSYAFYNCSSLSNITIPSGVTQIEGSAFSYCTSLTTLLLPSKITAVGYNAFSNCSNLGIVTIAGDTSGEANLSGDSFNCCEQLNSIIIKDGEKVINFGGYTFESVKSIYVGSPITNVQFGENLEQATFSKSITNIPEHLFTNCTGLTSIELPANLKSIGQYAFYGCSGLSSITIPSLCTTIGQYAFSGCSGLSSITMPSLCTTIGEGAFYRCKGLTAITLPENLTHIESNTFASCSNLTDVHLGSNIEYIGSGAFYENKKLKNLYYAGGMEGWFNINIDASSYEEDTNPLSYADSFYVKEPNAVRYNLIDELVVPESVDSIHPFAFTGYRGLKSIRTSKKIKSIGINAFDGCKNLATANLDVERIDEQAFLGCKIKTLTLGKSVNSIAKQAFYLSSPNTIYFEGTTFDWCQIDFGKESIGASNLVIDGKVVNNLIIPANIKRIKQYTFSNISSITSVELPSSIESIEYGAFEYCYWLESIKFNNENTARSIQQSDNSASGVTIGDYAFAYSTNLKEIIFPANIKSIGCDAFLNTAWYDNQPDGVIYVGHNVYNYKGEMAENTILTITEGTKNICEGAFQNQRNLVGINLPQSLETIGESAFYSCTNLTSIKLPQGISTIGENAFSDCSNITSIELPQTLETLNTGVLSYTGLKSITIPSGVKYLESSCISNCYNLTEVIIEDSNEPLYLNIKGNDGSALYDCINIENFYFGRNIELSVDKYNIFFYNYDHRYDNGRLSNLKNITFGKNVDKIGMREINVIYSMPEDNTLPTITSFNSTPPEIKSTSWENGYEEYWFDEKYGILRDCTLIIPEGSAEAYANAIFWQEFKNVETKDLSSVNSVNTKNLEAVAIYDINGKRLERPVKGLNIIKYNNGTVKKIIY